MKRFFKIFIIIFLMIVTWKVNADESPYKSAGKSVEKKPPGHHPELTAEQDACMKNKEISGLPAGDLKPTREEMLAALTKCNIEVDQTIEKLRDKYLATDDEDDRDNIKADMRTIFYATNSSDVKQKVRDFFRDYRDQSPKASSVNEGRTPASATR